MNKSLGLARCRRGGKVVGVYDRCVIDTPRMKKESTRSLVDVSIHPQLGQICVLVASDSEKVGGGVPHRGG